MSKYEWEKGTIALPTAAWAPFKKALHTGLNKLAEADYAVAMKLYDALVLLKKKTRGLDLRQALEAELDAKDKSYSYGWATSTPKYPFHCTDRNDMFDILLSKGDKPSLLKPQKKQFPLVNSTTLSFHRSDCSVTLDNKSRTVTWNVPENNHASDYAHDTALGKITFQELGKVKWTRNTGGVIVGNDENNRDSESEDGGGNYVVYRFGPLGAPRPLNLPRSRRTATPAKKSSVARK